MLTKRLLTPFFCLTVILAAPSAALATSYTVTSTADSGAGTLRNTIAGTANGDTVNVPASGSHYAVSSGTISIAKVISIVGTGPTSASQVIDGAGGADHSIFTVPSGGEVTFSNLTFTGGHTASNGGAIHNDGVVTVTNSTFTSNTAGNVGGAISQTTNGNSLTIEGSTFSLNSALIGGAIDLDNGTATITNSTFTGNSANSEVGAGSGAFDIDTSGAVQFQNVTIAGNSGGGVFDGAGQSLLVTFHNTIIANNTGGDCNTTVPDLGHNLDSDSSCFTAGTSLHANPLLGPLQDNGGPTFTMALLAGSPAINTGDPADCPATDQRGFSRPPVAPCDIGAFEFGATAPTSPIASTLSTKSAGAAVSKLPEAGQVPDAGLLTFMALAGFFYGRRLVQKAS